MSVDWPIDHALLVGTTIERVDAPATELVVLSLRDVVIAGARRRRALVLATGSSVRGIGLVERRPHGLAASSFVMLLRKHLIGARIERVRVEPASIELSLATREGRRTLELDLAMRPANLVLRGADDSIAGAIHPVRTPRANASPNRATEDATAHGSTSGTQTLEDTGRTLVATFATAGVVDRSRSLAQSVARALTRLRRRASAIEADLVRLAGSDDMRNLAALLAPVASRLPTGTRSARVTDWSTDPPREIDVALDPSRSPRAQVEAMFRRARGFERGRAIAEERARATAAAIAVAERLSSRLSEPADHAALDALEVDATEAGIVAPTRDVDAAATTSRRRSRPAHKPFKTFRAAGGRVVLVGKTAADNDALTLHHARPHDLWLHVRDHAGSHVVVPLDRGTACPSELLVDAAHLAVHFSAARGADRVEVTYAERRHVHKPKKAAVGAVHVDRERVMLLALDPARLAALLASELSPSD